MEVISDFIEQHRYEKEVIIMLQESASEEALRFTLFSECN